MTGNFFGVVVYAAIFCVGVFFMLATLDPDKAELAGRFASGVFVGYLVRAFREKK